jgi:hypothetical protein
MKPLSSFNKDKRKKSGYTPQCRQCRHASEKIWRDKHPEELKAKRKQRELKLPKEERTKRRRHTNIMSKFKMTVSDYEFLWDKQGGLCAICKRPERAKRDGVVKYLAIDHDHKTGKIRGLLCSACNSGIGQLQDDPFILAEAIRYLMKKR